MERPTEYEFNGPDTFLLILDQLMLKGSGLGNICRFVVTLADPLPCVQVREALDADHTYRWITTLRRRGGAWFKPPRWVARNRVPVQPIPHHRLDGAACIDLRDQRAINPRRESPFQIELFGEEASVSRILFTWHHALMDAHGAELFVMHLGGALSSDPIFFDPNPAKSDHSQWRNALGIKESLDQIAHGPFMSTFGGRRHARPVVRHSVIALDQDETSTVDENIAASGAQINKCLFYLAACARAVKHVVTERGGTPDDVVVSMPQDRRRRGAAGPIISNQVTFLFYRISADDIDSMKSTVSSLSEQMMELMRQDFPARFHRMMLLCRHVPPFIYRRMVQQPTRKRMASFFISDTGQSLDGFETFLGSGLQSAIHYPPNMYPPGLTFIFARTRGKLNITMSTMEEELSDDETAALVSQIRNGLLSPLE